MADDKSKTGKPDRDRINTGEDYEDRDWAKRLGVSEGELRAAVKKVGPMAKDVAKALARAFGAKGPPGLLPHFATSRATISPATPSRLVGAA